MTESKKELKMVDERREMAWLKMKFESKAHPHIYIHANIMPHEDSKKVVMDVFFLFQFSFLHLISS